MQTKLSLVDTSAWILALKKQPVPAIKHRIDVLLADNCVVTVGIIKLELLGGTKTEPEFRRLKSRLDALEQVETATSLWEAACDLAFTLRRSGLTVPYTDIVLAAAALRVGATVVHVDAHFDLMALEVGGTGVTVNAVCPAYVDTAMTERTVANVQARTGMAHDAALKAVLGSIGQQRLVTPEEVAHAVLAFCRDAAGEHNGQVIALDGVPVRQ